RQDVLEAGAAFGALPATALVRIDDLDTVPRPAQRDGHVDQRILPRRGLLVLEYLVRARLADIDDGFSLQMVLANLGGTQSHHRGRHHRSGGAYRRRARACRSGVLRRAHAWPPSTRWAGGSWRAPH